MPAWLLPLAMGALSAGGQILQNRSNARQTQRQQNFQERMSNTSVARSVEDYRNAGLNPALAYDRSASSPSGASTTLGDPVNTGINSAASLRRMQQELQIAKAESIQRMGINQTQSQADKALKSAQEAQLRQQTAFATAAQPFHLRAAAADAWIKEYLLPGAKNTADFDRFIGAAKPGIATAKGVAEMIKLFNRK